MKTCCEKCTQISICSVILDTNVLKFVYITYQVDYVVICKLNWCTLTAFSFSLIRLLLLPFDLKLINKFHFML